MAKQQIAAKAEIFQGTLDMLILKTLSSGPMHGFAIAQRLRAVSQDVLTVEEGSLYPALRRMERKGWVESAWGQSEKNRRANFYTLTEVGREQLRKEATNWEATVAAVGRVLRTA